jgi:hypothetical protein
MSGNNNLYFGTKTKVTIQKLNQKQGVAPEGVP